MPSPRYEILDVAVLADNSRFVSCGEDKAAFLWDVSTGVVVRRMQGHEQRINSCCFSTEGSVLFTGSYDKVTSPLCDKYQVPGMNAQVGLLRGGYVVLSIG